MYEEVHTSPIALSFVRRCGYSLSCSSLVLGQKYWEGKNIVIIFIAIIQSGKFSIEIFTALNFLSFGIHECNDFTPWDTTY